MKTKKRKKLIKLVLGFLHAWYENRTSNIGHLILQRVSFVKSSIATSDDKYTIILALQIFIHHIQNDAQIGRDRNIFLFMTSLEFPVQTMATILRFFLEQQLIEIEDFRRWYKDKNLCNYFGFNQAKECARAFIETLQS